MRKIWIAAALSLLLCLAAGTALAASSGWSVSMSVDTYSISRETFIRSGIGPCGADEYLALVCETTYSGSSDLQVKNAYVRVDQGEKWGWVFGTVEPGSEHVMHVYYSNMKKFAAGTHSVTFYINDKAISTQSVTIPRSWNSVYTLPTAEQISRANATATDRAPYIVGTVDDGSNPRFTEYAIDFKADYLPRGTYVAAANYWLDLSPLEKQYAVVDNQGISGYGGLQRWNDGTTHSIMSLWNIYCKDKKGNVVRVIQPKRIYPAESTGQGTFDGEGEGVHYLGVYDFQPGVWYRFRLACTTSPTTGNTVITEYICNLSTGVWTKIASYDMGVKGLCLRGGVSVFLENYHKEYAGEVRTAEFRNARIRLRGSGKWKNINRMYIEQEYNHTGSYRYGSDGKQFWMITTGVDRNTQKKGTFTVKNQQTGRPY